MMQNNFHDTELGDFQDSTQPQQEWIPYAKSCIGNVRNNELQLKSATKAAYSKLTNQRLFAFSLYRLC